MINKADKAKLAALMKEAKQCIKDIKPLISGLKKKDRETDEYKEKVSKASALQSKAMKLLDEYQFLSKAIYENKKR